MSFGQVMAPYSLSSTAHLLLGMVAVGARTGYAIRNRVERATSFFWAASNGQIYPELKRLEHAGLLVGRRAADGRRERTEYELTDAGRDALHEWLTTSAQLAVEQRHEGLLKLFFADVLTTEEALELVVAMRHRHELIRAGIEQAMPPNRPDRRFGHVVKEYGLGLHGWAIEWFRQIEERLRAELEATHEQRAGPPAVKRLPRDRSAR
jgi:DNA-binding PadR family transcriptional regulator